MAPLEPWEKVLVSAEFTTTTHGQMACSDCHGGVQSEDMAAAHTDLVTRPSEADSATCGNCHPQEVNAAATSLHATLDGYWTALAERGADPDNPHMQAMFGNHCASCHTSCGDCHISQPASVGGGLIDGHVINATPSLTRNCTACHGSRVGNEYMGKNEGLNPDVHFRQGRMLCTDCHGAAEMHGSATEEPVDHRYASVSPVCTDCHPQVGQSGDEVLLHNLHGEKLACQVCHSVSYTSCDGCHVAVSETTGKPFFETQGSYLTFLIGRNIYQSETRPYEYALVRHIPVAPTSFEFYGENLLPEFLNRPTWAFATPHNIQRNTPQTEACTNCHGNAEIFLTADKVAPAELDANLPVIVDQVPELNP